MNRTIHTHSTSRTALILLLATLLNAAAAQGAWAQWTGSGTSDNPYIIANATDLAKIRIMVDGGTTYENVYFLQTKDIDCSTLAVWDDKQGAGIGTKSHPFKGRYDGGGYKIKNLSITATDSQYAGLFGYIAGGAYQGIEANTHVAEVHRVVLDNPTITITATSSEQYAGAIVGYAGDCSQIYDNTVIGGSVTYTGGSNYNTDNSYVGGIVGNYGYGSNFQRLSGNTVVGTTLSGAGISGGLVGLLTIYGRFSGNFADASISGADFRAAGVKREGALVGSYNRYSGSVTEVNYYHSASGLTAYADYYTNYGSSYSMSPVADNEWVAPLYTVSGLPDGATVSGTSTVSHDGTGYYAQGAGLTIGTGSADKVFSDFTATGATAGSLVADKRSATVTVGTTDVTVSATLQTVSGTTADGLTWSLAQDDSGNYTRLTVGGNGAMQDYGHTTVGGLWRTTAPWGYGLTSVTVGDGVTAIGSYAFIGCQSLAAATIGSSVATIGQQAFDHCDALLIVTLPASVTTLGQGAFYNCIGLQRIDILHDGDVSLAANVFHNDNALQYITFPSPAALLANATGNWSAHADKLRAKFGNQLFTATTEGGTPAYQIATADDLRHLAAAVNATANISSGKTFRQTADIDLASGGNFTPIASRGGSYSFAGTYDGGGHTISGLTVSIDHDDIGLFGMVKGATVRNVFLLSPTVKATTTINYTVSLGALIGMCGSGSSNRVENCHVVNPTVSSSSTGSSNYVGAIIGNIWDTNTTVTNCYYYGGNATAACGYIENGAPVTHVCAAHLVTPADGVTIQTPMAADLGFTCDADNNGTPENYWRTGAQLTLGYTGTVADGYTIGYTATNGGTISGSTLTMPDADLAVAMSPQAIPWSGSGTASDPYVIEYPSQLLLLAHRVNGTNGETANTYHGKYFKLGADITFSHDADEGDDYAENYEAIGGDIGGYDRFFEGDFDGDGHTVSGIRIRKDGSGNADYYQGLFGRIASGANIHDVHLADARITGYKSVGGIAGYNTGEGGYISGCSVTDSYITANGIYYGTICGSTSNTDRLTNNYYHGCTVNGTKNATNVGCYGSDIAANHGALPAYRLALGENITTPPGTFVGDGESFATPPVGARLKAENGFTLAGNHYFASGYVFTPGSTLASGAAQGYTPRATLGGQLLDLYTPTGNDDLLAGKAIARLTITADCDGKTLDLTLISTREPVTVAYIKADGTTDEASAIALDGHEAVNSYGEVHLSADGTYYVGTDIAYANRIIPDGAVTLILANGKTMTLNGNTEGIDGYNLTIYGQSLDDATAGTLRYNGKSAGIHAYYYEQHSGNVSITTTGSAVSGIVADNVTLRGGNLTVSANGDNAFAINGTTYSILGGHLTATGTGAGAIGIRATANSGTAITLGWTRPADRITASSISTGGGTVAVKNGQALTDGSGNIYTGTLTADDIAALAGKTLQPCLVLNETDGVTPLTTLAGQADVPVIFTRTFSANVASTICLPFAISADQAKAAGKFYTFAGVDMSGSEWVVTMQETNATSDAFAANTPYLFMPSADREVIFSGTIGNVADTYTAGTTTSDGWTYEGTYETIEWMTDPGNIYGFAAEDKTDNGKNIAAGQFVKVAAGASIAPMRAYLKRTPSSSGAARMRGATDELPETMNVVLISASGEATTIGTITLSYDTDEWYSLDGRKLSGKPTKNGLYIRNGKKTVVK